VLFAQPGIRDFIAANFIPAWEKVRDVPTATIDFGGGRVLKRTVNGNVATYICAPDGRVVDILPGLSTLEAFLEDLRAALALAKRPPEEVAVHHLDGVVRSMLRDLPEPSAKPRLDAGKTLGVEPRVKRALGVDRSKRKGIEPRVKSAILDADLALLEADTLANRELRKPKIHELLSERAYTPSEITKRVYRDILDCDLDDPYLGLGEAAFGGGAYGDR